MPDQPEQQKKILIVDDDSFLLDMYALKFSKVGYAVNFAASADAALSMIHDQSYSPDIMLVDIVMPGIDGLEFVSRLRSEKLCPEAVIIMLTNQGVSEDIARAKNLNVDGYIVKATTIPSEVLSEVEKIYKSKKP